MTRGPILGFVLIAVASFAQESADPTGNDLLAMCTTQKASELDKMCLMYVAGFVGAASILGRDGKGEICIPEDVTPFQAQDIVVKWLKANPEKRHLRMDFQVWAALIRAFPCKATTNS
jgi:hypothetical protein